MKSNLAQNLMFPLDGGGITDTVPLCQIQSGSSDTESDTSDDKAVFHKRVQGSRRGTVSYLRLRKEDDKQKEIARRGHSKKRTSKYKVPQEKHATLQNNHFVLHYVAFRVIGSFEIGLSTCLRS